MWKKAGIVASASLAVMLALAPLANACPAGKDKGVGAEQVITGDDAPQDGLINLGDVNLLNGVNICPDVTAVLGLGNVLGILGSGSSDPNVGDAPISCEATAKK